MPVKIEDYGGSRKKQKINSDLDKKNWILGIFILSRKRDRLANSRVFYIKIGVFMPDLLIPFKFVTYFINKKCSGYTGHFFSFGLKGVKLKKIWSSGHHICVGKNDSFSSGSGQFRVSFFNLSLRFGFSFTRFSAFLGFRPLYFLWSGTVSIFEKYF